MTQGARSGGRPTTGHDREAWRRLFAGIAEGRVEALEALYDLAVDRVHGLAAWRLGSAEDAADVVQDVFVRVAESRETLREVTDPRAWLLTVAHRISVDHARRRSRRRTVELDAGRLVEPVSERPTRGLETRAVSAAIAALPDRLRVTVYLHHFAGCTFAETGRITGVPTFTAASRYRAAMRRLRKRLGGTR